MSTPNQSPPSNRLLGMLVTLVLLALVVYQGIHKEDIDDTLLYGLIVLAFACLGYSIDRIFDLWKK